ncbi:hypothetical protein MRB53_031603 [Persea americana]|uniref:Uncharacterized protein n=1 Tax=Persea americana TaxID=3435 RepID=A0ACC2KPF7_PERAE|nr:hypothetical protein MRB53_031603 [Persea americana]
MDEFDTKEPRFNIAVDSDHKATEFKIFSASPPHMRAFHLAWISLFSCFFSTFATPPLLPVIRDNLNLTDTDISNAGIASVSGAIFSRLAMGAACDIAGPRVVSASVSLIIAPVVFALSMVSSPMGFAAFRFLVGLSLANFVANQFWMSCMFSSNVVGIANGVAAGWANVGSGATQLLMPLIYSFLCQTGVPSFTAWRVAFFIPALLQALTAIAVLALGQDLPDGNFPRPQNPGKKQKDGLFTVVFHGLKNYREYFYDRFNLKIQIAGVIAASFGFANFISRPAGGVISDMMGRRFGMRGRLWSLWLVHSFAGLLCVLLGRVNSLSVSVVVMVAFSFFVQAASGLTFGVVPFVSRRALGVISGMTGSGGAVGRRRRIISLELEISAFSCAKFGA